MSDAAFLWIFSRGIELGVIVLCLLPIRAILRKRVPKVFSYLLWAALPVNVVYNLVMKLSPKSIRDYVYGAPKVFISETHLERMECVWIFGTAVVCFTMVYSYIQFLRRLVGGIRIKDNIYIVERIKSPFSLGLFFPKIYLPTSLSDEYRESVIIHEQVHIARKDIWVKHIAILFLAVFWFQPLLWFGYHLFINDMEEACDETVLRKMGKGFSAEYARALVEVSYQIGKVQGVAIGYGNGEIKSRVKNVMKYRQVCFGIYILAVILSVLFMVLSVPLSLHVPRLVQPERQNGMAVMDDIFSVEGTGLERETVSEE